MDNTTSVALQRELLLANQLELVTTTTVAGTLYGIAFTLFCLYVHSLAPRLRDGDRKKQAKFMLGYSTVIMICGLYNLVSNAWVTQNSYIKHADDPESPLLYIQSSFDGNAVTAIGGACQTAIDILTSAIQIWRVWVIWSATRYAYLATVLPVLCLLTSTGLQLRTIILVTTLPLEEADQLDEKTVLVEAVLQVATTILCTLLISLYLIFKQWKQRKLIGKTQGSTGYMSVVAMLIESYALESIWLLILACLTNQVVLTFFEETVLYIETLAYLVLYRVARGKAYVSQRGQNNISSLRWNRSNHATTQLEGTSEIHCGPHVSAIPEKSGV